MQCYKLTLKDDKYQSNDPFAILKSVIEDLNLPGPGGAYGFLFRQDIKPQHEFYFKTYIPDRLDKLSPAFDIEKSEQPSVADINQQYIIIGNGNLFGFTKHGY
jgi:hypothetical protein